MNQSPIEELKEEIRALHQLAHWESKALFTKKEILQYIGYPNLDSKNIVEGYEKLGLLKSLGGRPKVFPAAQVKRLKAKLSSGDLRLPIREEVRAIKRVS